MVRAPQILCVGRRRVPLLGSLYGGLVVLARETARVGRYVGLAEAVQADFLEYVEQEGVVQPMLSLRVNSRISGYVERIVAEEGARVRQGDTLLVLSNPAALLFVPGVVCYVQSLLLEPVFRKYSAAECPAQATHVLP